MVTAGIIGATGYVGVELVRLLIAHPGISLLMLSSVSFEGQNIADIYPNLRGQFRGKTDGTLTDADSVLSKSDVIFTALPHGLAEKYAADCIAKGKKLIDLSADFRYGTDEPVFKEWYGADWQFPEVHAESVYGLPEMYRSEIKNARVVGNPGCYVTAATLALLPVLKNGLIKTNPVIVDAKSGVTGTGRKPTQTNHFCESGESFSPYGIGKHRHQSEIARNMTIASGGPVSVVFTPHLVPMNRGIIATVYAELSGLFLILIRSAISLPDSILTNPLSAFFPGTV
ncbi:N-acetyl-gamma-glutamyl-phosphate reductase [Brucepastera parasyntrophica]|uniref:N-acetyl-gamma-glutamyl-phosphate reductase n=1 Tax=Brucepastera parasyntrophica TaxID=2880008 RepID=UPI002108778F|nr:N-acetyl-gamma-glutamyl-phosphate reductase [Brucepastera parasyntrophica]ULQ59617.1 N-acetyl-gamma-glutamyl-phosphate reductase [Brucepastera parasyntrophica]